MESERGMSPTMSLVIGIIIGSFTAMILIVIIVLKVRTGVDISEIKQVHLSDKLQIYFLSHRPYNHSSSFYNQSILFPLFKPKQNLQHIYKNFPFS